MSVDLIGFGHQEAETVTTAKTLDAADSGVVQNVTATAVITLPAVAALTSFTIRVGAPGITVSVDPDANDMIIGNGLSAANNKDVIATNQPAGSFITVLGNHADGYVVTAVSGTWTRES